MRREEIQDAISYTVEVARERSGQDLQYQNVDKIEEPNDRIKYLEHVCSTLSMILFTWRLCHDALHCLFTKLNCTIQTNNECRSRIENDWLKQSRHLQRTLKARLSPNDDGVKAIKDEFLDQTTGVLKSLSRGLNDKQARKICKDIVPRLVDIIKEALPRVLCLPAQSGESDLVSSWESAMQEVTALTPQGVSPSTQEDVISKSAKAISDTIKECNRLAEEYPLNFDLSGWKTYIRGIVNLLARTVAGAALGAMAVTVIGGILGSIGGAVIGTVVAGPVGALAGAVEGGKAGAATGATIGALGGGAVLGGTAVDSTYEQIKQKLSTEYEGLISKEVLPAFQNVAYDNFEAMTHELYTRLESACKPIDTKPDVNYVRVEKLLALQDANLLDSRVSILQYALAFERADYINTLLEQGGGGPGATHFTAEDHDLESFFQSVEATIQGNLHEVDIRDQIERAREWISHQETNRSDCQRKLQPVLAHLQQFLKNLIAAIPVETVETKANESSPEPDLEDLVAKLLEKFKLDLSNLH